MRDNDEYKECILEIMSRRWIGELEMESWVKEGRKNDGVWIPDQDVQLEESVCRKHLKIVPPRGKEAEILIHQLLSLFSESYSWGHKLPILACSELHLR